MTYTATLKFSTNELECLKTAINDSARNYDMGSSMWQTMSRLYDMVDKANSDLLTRAHQEASG